MNIKEVKKKMDEAGISFEDFERYSEEKYPTNIEHDPEFIKNMISSVKEWKNKR
jgi:hypothetical protein